MDRPLPEIDSADRGSPAKSIDNTKTELSDSVKCERFPGKISQADNIDSVSRSIIDRVRAQPGESLTVETGGVRATLVGVPQIRLEDLVYAHHRERLGDSTRFCALFDVENTSNAQITWANRYTKFIGTDDYTYRQSHISLDPSQLGPGCYSSLVDIEPSCRARIITPVEQLPSGVDVSRVIHRITFRGQLADQRLTYTL